MMEKRYENLRAIMREKGIDALYINSPENHLYVSGFDNPDGWLFVTLEKIYVFADFRYTEAAKAEAAPHCTVCLPGKPSFKEIAEECGAKVVGYEGKINWDTTKPDGTPRKLLDVSKLEKLGWKYTTELEEGIRLAYEDFLNNPMRAER